MLRCADHAALLGVALHHEDVEDDVDVPRAPRAPSPARQTDTASRGSSTRCARVPRRP